MAGVISLSAAIVGYGLALLHAWERLGLAVAGILLIDPGLATDGIGIVLLVVFSGRQYMTWRVSRKRVHETTAPQL